MWNTKNTRENRSNLKIIEGGRRGAERLELTRYFDFLKQVSFINFCLFKIKFNNVKLIQLLPVEGHIPQFHRTTLILL